MTQKRLEKVPAKHRKEVQTQLKKLALQIQNKRKKLGLTQEELAEALGISTMTLQFIEQGRRFPSLPTLFSILCYLKISFKTH